MMKKWDEYFLNIARESSKLSKDPSSILGAVAVKDKNILATGFNGFPRKVADYPERYLDRTEKLKYVVHAEQNCIYNAVRSGISLLGATLYVDGIATCSECAKGIIQAGFSKVIMRYKPMKSDWKKSAEFAKDLFKEAQVKYDCYSYDEHGNEIFEDCYAILNPELENS